MSESKELTVVTSFSEEVARIKGLRGRTERVLTEPNLIDVIEHHVQMGGSLIDLCRMWSIRYADVLAWVRFDPERETRYEQALKDRDEWVFERVLSEVRALATSDIRELYDEQGRLKTPDQWPESVARAVQAVEVKEEVDPETGSVEAYTKRVRLWDKQKAIETMLKVMGRLVERQHHTGEVKLEDVIVGSFKPAAD